MELPSIHPSILFVSYGIDWVHFIPSPQTTNTLLSRITPLQRTNLKHSRTSCNGVVSDGGVATGQDGVCLARDGRGAIWCCWDGDGETSGDGRCAARKNSQSLLKMIMSGMAERLTEQRLGR